MYSSITAARAAIGNSQFPGIDTLLGRLVYKTGTGAPTLVVADFVGQRYLDTSGNNWYTSYSLVAGEFKQDSN